MKNVSRGVSLDTPLRQDASDIRMYSKLLTTYLVSIEHLFTPSELNKIRGDLRRGDLSVATSPMIENRLSQAKATGNLSTTDFRQLYQFYSFFKKLPFKGNEDCCKRAAFNKLLAGEASCRVTNMTIECRQHNSWALFDRVRLIIQDILGNVPNNLLDTEVFFGPGSTVNQNKRSYEETSLFFKITDKLIVPERAKYYLAAHLSYQPNWVDMLGCHYGLQQNTDESRLSFELRVFRKHLVIVPDDYPSRIGFVPKSSDEHRAIGIEMNGLVPLQKCVGDYIRRQLDRKTPINLNSQQRNRHMARLAQTFGLATIDLANASSSISLELVRALLPSDWFCLIEAFRSTHGQCPGLTDEPIKYEMVSSMGNGFTFELESLIFFALAKATCEQEGLHYTEIKRSVSVFGDDIIVPARVAKPLIHNMTLFGFTANVEKSFLQGHFFESCGADYYNSSDVRPFFLKRQLRTVRDLFFFMNSLLFKAVSHKRLDYIELYAACFKLIPGTCDLGPLHFENVDPRNGRPVTDDLEAVLRVPLAYAQTHGGVTYDVNLQAWRYKKWVRVALEVPLSRCTAQYAVQHARYMTFLKGVREGKALLRGRTCDRQKTFVTSRWDGQLTLDELTTVKFYFAALAN
uniref:RNA-directed RNA polymerase n=1 Tax=Beihai levi-like virus 32 TaxID=1922418 RepID=A0A1L3KI74_9VIRU|nr:hypothetical protein [Beihai levi-like virus 32]